MTLEDKIKPYLILTKSFQYRIFVLKSKEVVDNEEIERLDKLKDLILNQMLFQIEPSDLNVLTFNNIFGMDLNVPISKKLEEKEKMSVSDLVKLTLTKDLEEIKQKLEQAEKEYNAG